MKKIMIYCQHLAGMGHLVRCREIMRALSQDFKVCFVSGGRILNTCCELNFRSMQLFPNLLFPNNSILNSKAVIFKEDNGE